VFSAAVTEEGITSSIIDKYLPTRETSEEKRSE